MWSVHTLWHEIGEHEIGEQAAAAAHVLGDAGDPEPSELSAGDSGDARGHRGCSWAQLYTIYRNFWIRYYLKSPRKI